MNIPRRLAAILVAAWSAVATVILGAAVYLLLTGQVHAQTTRADIEREIGGAFERSEWTAHERRAFTLSLIAHGLDLASSLASDERCVERNPLLGSHPSTMSTAEYLATLICLIVLGVVVLIAIVDHIRDREYWRKQREIEAALRRDRHQRLNGRGQP